MNYEYLNRLRQTHPAWRLLMADSAPLVISFLEKEFIENNVRSMRESVLQEKLDNYLIHIRSIYGDESFPRNASEYLDDWADNSRGWLRKYYPRTGDEAEFDITTSTEKVIEWIKGFEKKEFVGTESRLLLIFQMISDLVDATESDPDIRISELEKKRNEIEKEIWKIREGVSEKYDSRKIKETVWRIEEEIRYLMSDFREVEENFRYLDRVTREKIAAGSSEKSLILDDIFREHDAIEQSEQGKSFAAFWLFLMSARKQEELDKGTEKILSLNEVKDFGKNSPLVSMKYSLLDAGDRVKKTLGNLNEQLRTFLDDKIWLENRRIMDMIKSIEERALSFRKNPPNERDFFKIDSIETDIELTMERRLFKPPSVPPVMDEIPSMGAADFVPESLYSQYYVDESRLRDNINCMLSEKNQVSLHDICDRFPVVKGLSEIITYMLIASRDEAAVIYTSGAQYIEYKDGERVKTVAVPLIIFNA